jgi:hypothetical protein
MAEGKGMTVSTPKGEKMPKGIDHWEVRDAMHTMLRASKIVKDKRMLAAVKKEARKHAAELHETANQADMLAKRGLISDKQMAKLGAR